MISPTARCGREDNKPSAIHTLERQSQFTRSREPHNVVEIALKGLFLKVIRHRIGGFQLLGNFAKQLNALSEGA